MKKILLVVICLMMVAMMAVPASAATSVSVSASKKTAYRGNEIKFTVSVSGAGNCKKGGIEISYDENVFGIVSGGWLIKPDMKYFDDKAKEAGFAYDSATKISGKVFEFTLKVKSGAAFKASKVTVKLTLEGANASTSTNITVACEHKYGNWSSTGGTNHKRTCSICKATETKKHVFDNACDTKCNSCNYERKTQHKYSDKLTGDAQNHFYACTGCGKQKDAAPHTPGDPATEEHGQNCTVCGYEIAPKLEHIHQQVGEIQINDTHHWYDCATCEENAAYEAHVYAFACSSTCSTCGYKREVTHTKAEGEALTFAFDETGHWYPCTVCAEPIEFSQHTSDGDPVAPHCTVCGGELKHEHSYSDEWSCDGDAHWHECACGAKDSEIKHTWDEGVITMRPKGKQHGEMIFTCTECGGVDAAVVVGGLPFELPALPEWAWYAIAGGAALIFLAPCVFMIVVLVKMGKKAKGKFSGN